MSLLEHIEHLIRASADADSERQVLSKRHGIDLDSWVNPLDDNFNEVMFGIRKTADDLKFYLNGLDYDTLLKLEALMYFGRDGGRLIKRLASTLVAFTDRNDEKDEIIDTMVEKLSSFSVYFEGAIEALRKRGVDPENVWQKIREMKESGDILPASTDSSPAHDAAYSAKGEEKAPSKKKPRLKSVQFVLPWDDLKLASLLGAGGNGQVWSCRSDSDELFAIKFLTHRENKKRYDRFKSEIALVQQISPSDGIIPIIRSYLPANPSAEKPPCYMMPVAKPFNPTTTVVTKPCASFCATGTMHGFVSGYP